MDRRSRRILLWLMSCNKVSISFPVLLFTEYKRLGLNEGQVMLLLHILLFNEKEGITFPTISQLEERMSVKGDRIIQWLQVLVRKGFLSIEETLDDGGAPF